MHDAVKRIGPLRVPIVAGALLAYVPLAALVPALPGASLLRGLFDLTALSDVEGFRWWLRTFVTFGAAWVAMGFALVAVYQSAAMIHDFAGARLFAPGSPIQPDWLGPRSHRVRSVLYVPAALAIVASLRASLDAEDSPRLAVWTAAACALPCVVAALVLAAKLSASVKPRLLAASRRVIDAFLPHLAVYGYGATDAVAPAIDPFPHHAWAFLFLVTSGVLWVAVAVWSLFPGVQEVVRVPALCSLWLLVMAGTWLFSSLTFFFDYYRIPIVTLLLVPVSLVGVRDYAYERREAPPETIAMLLPRQLAEARGAGSGARVLAIASAGGGIQASAWTARVLAGLMEAAGDRRADFLQRIAVVSGVSGGSTGLAPFVLALAAGASSDAAIAAKLADLGSTSSLDPIASTWATLDLFPVGIFPDRGMALERTWARTWKAAGLSADVRMSALAAAARDGRAPGVMFNATSMTDGERIVLGTTVPTSPGGEPSVAQNAIVASDAAPRSRSARYAPRTIVPDIDVATAVRLSATFPFVSPAARCRGCEGARQYVVDGGYVDNLGTESLGEWSDALLSDSTVGITIVQIVSFREESCDGEANDRLRPSQLAVPLRTLYAIRGPGQGRRSIVALTRLKRRFGDRLCLHSFVYDRCRDDHGFAPPLSWHLTPGQKAAIDHEWDERHRQEAARVVSEVLATGMQACTSEVPPR